jgi:hypothetical protein
MRIVQEPKDGSSMSTYIAAFIFAVTARPNKAPQQVEAKPAARLQSTGLTIDAQ